MKNAKELFSFRHSQRTITIWRQGRSHFKRYIGAVNGEVCAEAPAKGELLRRLIEIARTYPTTDVMPVYPRRERRGGRPRRVAPAGNSR